MDITPLIPQGKKLINKYGAGGFTINGEKIEGNILITPEQVIPGEGDEIDVAKALAMITCEIEILLIGSGREMVVLPRADYGSKLEVMATGPACRTYNVLLAEGRDVAALLMGV
jgi:uncharacterized protein